MTIQTGHYLAYIDPATRDLHGAGVHGFAEQLTSTPATASCGAEHAFSRLRAAVPRPALPDTPQAAAPPGT